jgi:Tfp pilus assembly protein PilN
MIEINLLPREFRKKSVSLSFGKSGLYVIAGVVGVLVMLAGITIYQMRQLSTLEANIRKARQRAAMLEKDIKLVDALIDVKQKIHRRMAAVEQLDSHRSTWVRILEDVARNVPEFVWLGRFKEEPREMPDSLSNQQAKQTAQQPNQQQGQQGQTTASVDPWIRRAEVEGFAFTLNALASFMINMMRSDYFDNVELVSTDEVTFQEQKAYNFVLTCDLHYLSDEELRGLIAQANDQSGSRRATTSHKSLN